MKKIMTCLFLFVACNTAITNQNPGGMYVCRFEQEFARVNDSLLLRKLNDHYYKITRHSGVTNKSNNKKQRIAEVWKLEFEASKNVFIIIWDEDKHELIFGNRDYVKCCK
jgi:hypothetical protein